MPWVSIGSIKGDPGDLTLGEQIADAPTASQRPHSDDAFIFIDSGVLSQLRARDFLTRAKVLWGYDASFFEAVDDFTAMQSTITANNTALATDNIFWSAIAGSGTPQITQTEGTDLIPGVLNCETGTGTTSRCGVTSPYPQLPFFNAAERMEFGARVAIPTLTATGQTFSIVVGLVDDRTSATPANGFSFYLPTTSGGNWQLRNTNSSTSTTNDSGVAPVAGTFVTLYFIWDEDAGVARYYIDGVQVGAFGTNKPANSTVVHPYAAIIKATGSTTRVIKVDKMYFKIKTGAPFLAP